MDMLAAEGYLVGMYTGKYFSTQLPMDVICAKYEVRIAHYLASGNGTYFIATSQNQNFVVDVEGISAENSANVQQYEATHSDAQLWQIVANDDGTTDDCSGVLGNL